MTPLERLAQVSPLLNALLIVKLFILLGLMLYLIFAMVVVRQVQLMNQTLKGSLNLPLRLFAWVHFGLAVLVFLFALVVL